MAWNMAGEFVNPKNMTVGSNDTSSVVKATFHLSPSLILILLYPYLKSNFMNTFLISIFLIISEISGSG